MCKPWKDGRISRDNENFESYSAHKRRINLDEEILEYLEDEE